MRASRFIITALFALLIGDAYAQQTPVMVEEKLESGVDEEKEGETDDHDLLELDRFRKNQLNLNDAGTDQLQQLGILNDLQVENLVLYRELLGSFLDIYELQAVPSWDIATIRKLLPFVTIETPVVLSKEISKRFRQGEHSLLFRVSRVLEKAKGFGVTIPGSKYLGSPQSIFFRYRYVFKDLLQFGILGEKDAGELFFKSKQKIGFDFYSFHFYAGGLGFIKTIVAGDFRVNMGQGLVQWQGLAYRKSAEVMSIKRQSAVLKPYHGAGEFYFFRGAGLTVQKSKFESTVFASVRKLGANLTSDTFDNKEYISSFLTAGNHRNGDENETRNNVSQLTAGFNLGWRDKKASIDLNGIYYQFSKEVKKRAEPYNLYAISGSEWYNASMDYSYTYKNFHFFGEFAMDKNFHKACLHGLLFSVDSKADISLLHRSINKAYQSVNGNSFTENSFPTNEKGFFAGITIRPKPGWRIDAYTDVYYFPWLKYRVDAPSHGSEFLIQATYTPSKQVEIYTRFRARRKQINESQGGRATHRLIVIPRANWRTHINYKINRTITLRNRVELAWYQEDPIGQQGFLVYGDLLYKPMMKPFSVVGRLQYFETDSYETRIYAYENDVLYNYTISPFADQGLRGYLVLSYDFSKKLSAWLRWAMTIYNDIDQIGSGLDEIQGNRKTELKIQAKWVFQP